MAAAEARLLASHNWPDEPGVREPAPSHPGCERAHLVDRVHVPPVVATRERIDVALEVLPADLVVSAEDAALGNDLPGCLCQGLCWCCGVSVLPGRGWLGGYGLGGCGRGGVGWGGGGQ